MAREKVGIALGGGSALGFAHLGVLKVLEENKIPIDLIAGCSMGSLLGGIYAAGCSLNKLIDFAHVFNDRKYIDPNISFSGNGALHGDKVSDLIRTMTENISIEQSKIPFACLATCIEEAGPRYFVDGPMYEAIRASISLPGVFDPVRTADGKTLVDGGMWDRTALSALEKLNPDVRIAVDVSYRGTPLPTPRTAMEVLSASYEILSWHAVEPRYADANVLILPDTTAFNGASFKDISPIIESGYKAAQEALPRLRKVLREAGVLQGTPEELAEDAKEASNEESD